MSKECESTKLFGLEVSKLFLSYVSKVFCGGVAIGALTAIAWLMTNSR